MGKIIKVEDLTTSMAGIYKLNYPNGKIYIGKANNLKRRMWEHNRCADAEANEHLPPCDDAIRELGKKFLEIEILEFTEADDESLNEAEAKWEKIYNPRNPEVGYNIGVCGVGGGGAHSVLTDEQIIDIRKRRFEGKERKKDVYKDYEHLIGFSGFEKIWLGNTCTWVGREYLIPANSISRQEYSSKANSGANNGRAKLTEDDVRAIRQRYDNGETVASIHKTSYSHLGKNTIYRVCKRESWTNVI